MGRSGAELSVEIADDFTQVVAHALAHVAIPGPGDLRDPRYLAWARAHIPAEDHALLRADAELLGRLWAADPRHARLHGFFQLFADWAGFWACADRPLAELREHEVADPAALAAVRELPGAELLHACCALVGPSLRVALDRERGYLQDAAVATAAWLERLAAVVPGLADARVELVWPLGARGRALPGRILIGSPDDWSGCSPARQAVLAAHEHCVQEAAAALVTDDYAIEEWAALRSLAERLREADPALRAAHHDWLASLDLAPLRAELIARGVLDPAEAEACSPARLSAGP